MTGPDRDRELEALLRSAAASSLAPPEEMWDSVRRRARRRRQGKALMAVSAAAVVVAGAVPAVIAVRDTSGGNQQLQLSQSPGEHFAPLSGPRASSGPKISPATLKHLQPETISFVSQTDGWVSGETKVAGGTVDGGFGRTANGGKTWSAEQATPPPTGLVRFATDQIGFSFGAQYQMTHDGGRTWQTLPSPGYIPDLETFNGRVWALVQSCQECRAPRLFTATINSPTLHRVRTVAPISANNSAIILNGSSVFVTGGEDLWRSRNGLTWRKGINPCGTAPQAFSAYGPLDLAAECTPARGVGSIFESNDGGLRWTDIANLPNVTASATTLSAGTFDHLIITTGTGPPWVTFDDGQHWRRADTGTAPVVFAAYISPTHIVGIRGGDQPAFVTSYDSGHTWSATPFAR
jgi:photosystem II stability/assembly factor-like uncharacterized protein